MEQHAPGHEEIAAASPPWAADEELLDRALLGVLDARPGAQADVFAERTERLLLGGRAGRDSADGHPPLWRLDEGVAVRALAAGAVRGLFASGPCDERVLGLAAALGTGGAPPRPAGAADAAGFADAERSPEQRAVLAALLDAAAGEVAREARIVRIDVSLTLTRRRVHVVSSEWGHAQQGWDWQVAWIAAEAEAPDGRRLRAGRGTGAPVLTEALDARRLVADAARAALCRLDARPIPAGRPIVLVAPGAGGVLVHEAVGHSLEGDVVERGASFLAGRIGESVAVPGLTVIDDPLAASLAGSHAHDDEGAPGTTAVLIEGGVLRGILTDGVRAGFRRERATGHGRRQGFRDQPLPRMTNTLVLAGDRDPAELLATTADGILVTRMERGSADPVRGKFQVRVTEGWRIEDGRLTHPLEEGLLVGASDRFLQGIEIGADVAWDDGCGTCGREGQWVPVAVGQPTLRCARGIFDVA